MTRKNVIRIIAVLAATFKPSFGIDPIILIGPMIHFNYGNHTYHTSYSFEVSYWDFVGIWPYGADAALEYGDSHFRIYSEAQTGLGFVGLALGPVLDLSKENGLKIGFQNSLWANYFGGIDFRWRRINGSKYYSPGIYLKIPPVNYGSGDENHHHHHFHWDD